MGLSDGSGIAFLQETQTTRQPSVRFLDYVIAP